MLIFNIHPFNDGGTFERISEIKILLFYKFTPLVDPNAIRLWQRTLCESLGLKGRIIISKHGINGTVGGELEAIKSYRRITREYPGFHNIDWKWSDGIGEDFPRLAVRVRDEIVTFGVPEEIVVDESGVVGGGVMGVADPAPIGLHNLTLGYERHPSSLFVHPVLTSFGHQA